MPNMDYPGPCLSCSAIDGCSTDSEKQKAVEHYCKGLEMELNSWKARLFDVFAHHDRFEGNEDMTELLTQIKSTVAEIERLMEQTKKECPANMSAREGEFGQHLEKLRFDYTKALEIVVPGWFGE
ncbi:MAG: hypothetical protein PWQ57_2157 [Desulfovibrionales bacterium]|jgi:hypothetical protein|nr:hypothetical protein [Desulfovibrionales bacterium]